MTAIPDIEGLIERLKPSWAVDEAISRAVVHADLDHRRNALSDFLVSNNALKSEAADALSRALALSVEHERAITDDGNAPGWNPDPTFNGPPLGGASLSVGEQEPVTVKPPRRIIYVTETSPEDPNSFPVYLDQMGERNDRLSSQARADAIEARAALEEIARQRTSDTMREDEEADADWMGGFDTCVKRARTALAKAGAV